VPRELATRRAPFVQLFRWLLRRRLLPLGLYRCNHDRCGMPYAVLNPAHDLRLLPGDTAFVIAAPEHSVRGSW
jgi:hypothetical protein